MLKPPLPLKARIMWDSVLLIVIALMDGGIARRGESRTIAAKVGRRFGRVCGECPLGEPQCKARTKRVRRTAISPQDYGMGRDIRPIQLRSKAQSRRVSCHSTARPCQLWPLLEEDGGALQENSSACEEGQVLPRRGFARAQKNEGGRAVGPCFSGGDHTLSRGWTPEEGARGLH